MSAGETGTDPAVPVLVELFTSEGCSSCPPADALLAELDKQQPVKGAVIIPLSLHVDYWNSLGWPDRFSSAQFTRRQNEYVRLLDVQSYTPQMIVDGRRAFVGSDREMAVDAIKNAARLRKGNVQVKAIVSGDRKWRVKIELSAMPATTQDNPGDVILAITEHDLHTAVKAGENGGRTLDHTAVVRILNHIGQYDGPKSQTAYEQTIAIPSDWNLKNLRLVSFVQSSKSHQVIAVGQQRLADSGL